MDDLGKRRNERIEFLSISGEEQRRLIDLSTTGVCCVSRKPHKADDIIVVKINDISLKALVIYCAERDSSYRMGLKFVKVLPEVQAKINELVDAYSKGVPVDCTVVE